MPRVRRKTKLYRAVNLGCDRLRVLLQSGFDWPFLDPGLGATERGEELPRELLMTAWDYWRDRLLAEAVPGKLPWGARFDAVGDVGGERDEA
jgi:hypothetical protein